MRDDWSVKEVVEPRSGEIHRLYWYKGRVCKRVLLDTPMARQMAGYVLIEKDLRSATVWLDEIVRIRGEDAALDAKGNRNSEDRERYNLVKGLFVAALTFYGKAFAQCEGRRVKLEGRQLSADFHEAHDDAISFRNNFAAHSGAKLLEKAEIALVFPPKSKQGAQLKIYKEMSQPDYAMAPAGKKSFAELISHVREIPLRKIKELHEKVMKEEVLPKGYSYWATK